MKVKLLSEICKSSVLMFAITLTLFQPTVIELILFATLGTSSKRNYL